MTRSGKMTKRQPHAIDIILATAKPAFDSSSASNGSEQPLLPEVDPKGRLMAGSSSSHQRNLKRRRESISDFPSSSPVDVWTQGVAYGSAMSDKPTAKRPDNLRIKRVQHSVQGQLDEFHQIDTNPIPLARTFSTSLTLNALHTPSTDDESEVPPPLSACQQATASSPADGTEYRQRPSRPARRARTEFTEEQRKQLERSFSEEPYPDIHQRDALAEKLSIREDRIQVWFQNRRARSKNFPRQKKPSTKKNSTLAEAQPAMELPVEASSWKGVSTTPLSTQAVYLPSTHAHAQSTHFAHAHGAQQPVVLVPFQSRMQPPVTFVGHAVQPALPVRLPQYQQTLHPVPLYHMRPLASHNPLVALPPYPMQPPHHDVLLPTGVKQRFPLTPPMSSAPSPDVIPQPPAKKEKLSPTVRNSTEMAVATGLLELRAPVKA